MALLLHARIIPSNYKTLLESLQESLSYHQYTTPYNGDYRHRIIYICTLRYYQKGSWVSLCYLMYSNVYDPY